MKTLSKLARRTGRVSLQNMSATATLTATKREYRSDLFGTDIFRWQNKDELAYLRAMEYVEPRPQTIKIAITGSSGNIGSALAFRLASGEMFGKNQRVQIHLFDITPMIEKVKGVAMELYDCAFPTLDGVLVTDSLERVKFLLFFFLK